MDRRAEDSSPDRRAAASTPGQERAPGPGAAGTGAADAGGTPAARAAADMQADVAAGLRASPRRLPSYLFYDDEGSRLFEEITRLPEYYLTRTEISIFEAHGDEIAALAGAPRTIVELGAGSGGKTGILLARIVPPGAGAPPRPRAAYLPIDVSAAALAAARDALARPELEVRPLLGRIEECLPRISSTPGPRLLLFIGSSIGNWSPEAAAELLALARRHLAPGDRFLLGADLRKDPAILLPAYDDPAGVTAAFNRNVLARLNRELGATFDLARFRHIALWNEAASRVEMWLESTRAQRVRVAALDLEIELAAGERIHTEDSYKLPLEAQLAILRRAGLSPVARWIDPAGLYAVHMAAAA